VDDENWKATFDLVIYMNREFDRGIFLKDGAFHSKAAKVAFLASITDEIINGYPYMDHEKMLNAIWYTLREDPDLIYT
jgi:hypothetical protein